MDDEPRSHDKEVSAFGGETRRLGDICVTFLCNRYLSHEPFCQRELPREGGSSASRLLPVARAHSGALAACVGLKRLANDRLASARTFNVEHQGALAWKSTRSWSSLMSCDCLSLAFLSFFFLRRKTRRPAWSGLMFQQKLHMYTKKTQRHNKMAAAERSRTLTGICLLIEDCSSIIQPVPRKKVKCESCLHHTARCCFPERSRSLL